jgi:hypothetical protein
MNKLFRALIAGYGAKKLGGGCFTTVLVFILIYWALGNCNSSNRTAPVRSSSLIQENKVTAYFVKDKEEMGSTYFLYNNTNQYKR